MFHPYRRNDGSVFLYAFHLIELDGDDLRHMPLTVRKSMLANVIAQAAAGLRLNEHLDEDGPIVFRHACKLGLEGHRVEAQGLALQFGAVAALDQEQEPKRAGSKAGSRRGLGLASRIETRRD
jgi:hypothetical protein